MKLETSKGKVFDVRVVTTSIRRKDQVLCEIYDDREIPDISADFNGLDSFRTYDEAVDGVIKTYEGFRRLSGIQLNDEYGTVRLTLDRGRVK